MHAQQELVNTTQSTSNKNMNTTFINTCIGRVHPLSIPNHPGRVHRKTDKLPKGVNHCGKEHHKNKSMKPVHTHKIHPLSNPNHPGRVHRKVDKLPKGINQKESVEYKITAPLSHYQEKGPSHKAHKIHPLSNPNHPGRIHRKMDKQPKGINQMASVKCKNNTGKPFHKAQRIHPLSNINHPGKGNRKINHLPSVGDLETGYTRCVNGNRMKPTIQRHARAMKMKNNKPMKLHIHPLSDCNHPGRVHRKHQDKVPNGIHQCKPVKYKNNTSSSHIHHLPKHHHKIHKKNTMSISFTVLPTPITSC